MKLNNLINRFTIKHAIYSLVTIIIYLFIIFRRSYTFFSDRGREFLVGNYIITPLWYLFYASVAALPLIVVLRFFYKGKINKQYILLIKLGAIIIIPLFIFLDAFFKEDNYRIIFSFIILVSNILVFAVNEACFHINLKKLK